MIRRFDAAKQGKLEETSHAHPTAYSPFPFLETSVHLVPLSSLTRVLDAVVLTPVDFTLHSIQISFFSALQSRD